jgi:Sec-independent protein secretion pathway component TatC
MPVVTVPPKQPNNCPSPSPNRRRAVLAIVLVGALVTYGGVNLMAAFFVIMPRAFFGTTSFAAPGLELSTSAIIFGFALWWVGVCARSARWPRPTCGARPSLASTPR